MVIYMQTKILSCRVRPHAAVMSIDPARDEGAVTCAAGWNAASCLSSSATRVARACRSAWSASRSHAPIITISAWRRVSCIRVPCGIRAGGPRLRHSNRKTSWRPDSNLRDAIEATCMYCCLQWRRRGEGEVTSGRTARWTVSGDRIRMLSIEKARSKCADARRESEPPRCADRLQRQGRKAPIVSMTAHGTD